jgi:enamine deaminase RidA (YjgF/YER057c/UK114 family)
MIKNVYTGRPWETKAAYCRAKRIGNTIVVSGTVAVDEQGNVIGPGDLYRQTQACIQRILTALQQLEADASNVIRTRAFVTDISRFDEYARAHRETFEGIDPAATCVEVARLIRPEFLVEVEVDAVLLK